MAFWSKKQDGGLPELPPIPEVSHTDSAEEETEAQPLPTFPESPVQKGFSQAAIKEAVSTDEETEESESPVTMEMNEEEMISAPPAEERIRKSEPIKSTKSADIYVKVDRFVSARKALENAQMKVEEISELLKTIRETKMREEQELAYLEKELAATKARVQEITENIFEKV